MKNATLILCGLLFATFTQAAQLQEMTSFGANPGKLKMFKYVPQSAKKLAPVVVLLHGCTQGAGDFDNETGWAKVADQTGTILLLAQQERDNNGLRCFNWFLPEHSTRDSGEMASVIDGLKKLETQHSINSKKVFVTGLSAGAAMTSALLANYPELFKGGAIVAGLPYGCANDVMSGIMCMNGINNSRTPEQWGNAVRNATNFRGPRPSVQIWQGLQDPFVKPSNALELEKQWSNVLNSYTEQPIVEELNGLIKTSYANPNGEIVLESFKVLNAGHGYPISQSQGCGVPGSYIIETGICAAEMMAQFWKL
ncbi:MAG: PHB depolymerase family esterase [Bdellovibrionales bacterium]|nr:PHB depolymerase family esterase [Bdellovibrionales bacterium]